MRFGTIILDTEKVPYRIEGRWHDWFKFQIGPFSERLSLYDATFFLQLQFRIVL